MASAISGASGRGGAGFGLKTIARLCQLYERQYRGFSVQHFYDHAVERHGFRLSYTWTRLILQEAGLVEKAPGRGFYRRKRERRPLVGLLVHLDASTHVWLPDVALQDLVVALDDADGRILYARFWPQEGTASTFAALAHVRAALWPLRRALHRSRQPFLPHCDGRGRARPRPYDAGAAGAAGARHPPHPRPLAASARPQRTRLRDAAGPPAGGAARCTASTTTPRPISTSRRPSCRTSIAASPSGPLSPARPSCPSSGSISASSSPRATNASWATTVPCASRPLVLQLPPTRERLHYVRCPVLVHELPDDTLGLSYQGRLLARYDRAGRLLEGPARRGRAA